MLKWLACLVKLLKLICMLACFACKGLKVILYEILNNSSIERFAMLRHCGVMVNRESSQAYPLHSIVIEDGRVLIEAL